MSSWPCKRPRVRRQRWSRSELAYRGGYHLFLCQNSIHPSVVAVLVMHGWRCTLQQRLRLAVVFLLSCVLSAAPDDDDEPFNTPEYYGWNELGYHLHVLRPFPDEAVHSTADLSWCSYGTAIPEPIDTGITTRATLCGTEVAHTQDS